MIGSLPSDRLMKEDEAPNHRVQSHLLDGFRTNMEVHAAVGFTRITSHGHQADHRLFHLEASGSRSLRSPESRNHHQGAPHSFMSQSRMGLVHWWIAIWPGLLVASQALTDSPCPNPITLWW